MGVVYEAEDTTLGRKVALKFLPDGMNKDAGMLARLQREARAASALNHPNICTIYAVEEDQGHFFISMELLEGQPLDQLLAEKTLTNDQIIDYGLQICDALEAAHAKGVIHRDIKPANIFVTNRNQVKVLDFGLAKVEEMQASASTVSGSTMNANTAEFWTTRPGTAMGTIAYMSPEQARGEDLDTRTDIFSFGVVLYQMATRKIPFEGTTSAVVFSKLLEHPPVSPVELNPGLHTQLDEIIGKMLEKDRTLRYQSAGGVAADLRRLKRDTSSVRAAAAPGKSTKPASSKTGLIAAAVIAIAVIGAVGYLVHARRATPAVVSGPSLSIHPLTTVGDANNAYLSEGLTQSITTKLQQIPGLKLEPEQTGTQQPNQSTGVHDVFSGSAVRSGDAIVVNAELADSATHQPVWNHQYTANTSELQALESQIAADIAEHAGAKLGWEDRQKLQKPETSSADAYLLYLQARHDIAQGTPDSNHQASALLTEALQKDSNFTAAASALASLPKESSQEAAPQQPEPTPQKAAPSQKVVERRSAPPAQSTTLAPVPAKAAAPAQGTFSIDSKPDGASIFLDGKDTGRKTPAQIMASAGAHSIVLKQAGYADGSANANLDGGATVTVSETLNKLAEPKEIKAIGGFKKIFGGASESTGRVRIETKPKGAKVTVGGQSVSKPTPVEFDLSPGSYQITLEADGYEALQRNVEVQAGKRVQLSETLTKK